MGGTEESPTGKPDKSLGRFKSEEARARSLGNLKRPRRPGDPPLNPNNLGGRPKRDGIATRELRRLLLKKAPNDAQGRSHLQLVVESLIKQAEKGNVYAQQLIWEKIEGKVPLPLQGGEMPANITVVVNRNVSRADCELLKEGQLVLEANTPVEERGKD
jgi:hypothetical protein